MNRSMARWAGAVVVGASVLVAGCGSDADSSVSAPTTAPSTDDLFPDVVSATATAQDDGTWTVTATVSSPYDTPERYADGFRVVTAAGVELGVRELAHDHAGEQPFTRTLGALMLPDDVDVVIVEGHDQRNGWGGATVTIELMRP